PLEASLRQLVGTFERRSGATATLALEGDFDALSQSQRLALFHIVQEALSNVREHSRARSVRVAARTDGGRVDAEIVDDGIGFEVEPTASGARTRRRLGLAGMGERARLLGGSVTLESAPGGPTRVTVVLPAWRRR